MHKELEAHSSSLSSHQQLLSAQVEMPSCLGLHPASVAPNVMILDHGRCLRLLRVPARPPRPPRTRLPNSMPGLTPNLPQSSDSPSSCASVFRLCSIVQSVSELQSQSATSFAGVDAKITQQQGEVTPCAALATCRWAPHRCGICFQAKSWHASSQSMFAADVDAATYVHSPPTAEAGHEAWLIRSVIPMLQGVRFVAAVGRGRAQDCRGGGGRCADQGDCRGAHFPRRVRGPAGN